MFRYTLIFIYFVILASCTNEVVQENPTLEGFSKRDITEHWILQLPIGAKIGSMDSVSSGKMKVTFPNDSLFIHYDLWVENITTKNDCSFSTRVKRMESGGCEGICQGDGSIHIAYVPIVNHTTHITGCRGDWESNQRRFVVYLVYDCETGESLTLDFEGVGAANSEVVKKIITSLEFRK